MASYLDLIRNDIFYHQSCGDAAPPTVLHFVQSLQNELKLPRWLESGPVPYTNKRVLNLFDQLRASEDASHNGLWDDKDSVIDDDFQQRLHAAFNTALEDCARIQAVLTTERATRTPFPKQSFLATLVRNATSNADAGLYTLDDVPVILPRHFSGGSIPLLKYLKKSLLAPLIMSICEEMPVRDLLSDVDHEPSGDEEDGTDPSIHSLTISEILAEEALPPQFEVYFLAYSSSTAPPSACHIPVLCMADEDELPVMMSSILYQRRVWHIDDPLVGVEFSKYDTIITLYVGWLEEDVSSSRVLPRVHLWEMETSVTLDLASPSIALAVSRLLCGLKSHISGIRDTITQSVDAVVSETRSHSSLSWRIDTDVPQQGQGLNMRQDTINQWVELMRQAFQQISECE